MTYGVGRIGFLLAYASWMIATGFLFKFLASTYGTVMLGYFELANATFVYVSFINFWYCYVGFSLNFV